MFSCNLEKILKVRYKFKTCREMLRQPKLTQGKILYTSKGDLWRLNYSDDNSKPDSTQVYKYWTGSSGITNIK